MLDLARAALLYGTQKTDGTEILAGNICFAADNADGAPVNPNPNPNPNPNMVIDPYVATFRL
jgi:hypothetical protein